MKLSLTTVYFAGRFMPTTKRFFSRWITPHIGVAVTNKVFIKTQACGPCSHSVSLLPPSDRSEKKSANLRQLEHRSHLAKPRPPVPPRQRYLLLRWWEWRCSPKSHLTHAALPPNSGLWEKNGTGIKKTVAVPERTLILGSREFLVQLGQLSPVAH